MSAIEVGSNRSVIEITMSGGSEVKIILGNDDVVSKLKFAIEQKSAVYVHEDLWISGYQILYFRLKKEVYVPQCIPHGMDRLNADSFNECTWKELDDKLNVILQSDAYRQEELKWRMHA